MVTGLHLIPRGLSGKRWSSSKKVTDAKVQEKIRGLCCPEHLKAPTAIRTVSGWKIQSCCQTMQQAVDARQKQ
jgi:hypothetical protein